MPPCVSCGLCCDGTLYNRAKTSSDEAPRVRAYGLTVHADEAHFVLPCPRLDGTACTIYDDRFTVCRTFRCKVLRRFDTGELDRSRADAMIAEVKRLRGIAEARVAGAGQSDFRRQQIAALSDWATRADPVDRRETAASYLALVAFERFAHENFRPPPNKTRLAPDDGSGEVETKGAA